MSPLDLHLVSGVQGKKNTIELQLYSKYCLFFAEERVVLSITDFVCGYGLHFSDRSEHVLLARNKREIECSKCMLRIERRSIGFAGRSSSHSTDHET